MVVDRWRWVKRELPETRNEETLLDVGCGTGAFTIGAARRGYRALGLSWDRRNQEVAARRAARSGVADQAKFEIQDVRKLQERIDLTERFDVCLCCECAEHILNDQRLFVEMTRCLKPGGRLLFTAPNFLYRAMSRGDLGPFCKEETGWHVRRGYSPAMLRELCRNAGLEVEQISGCSGFFSQKITALQRLLQEIHSRFGWALTTPLLPLTWLDGVPWKWFGWPDYSICLVAVKPRWRSG